MKRSPLATAKRTVRRGVTWRSKRSGDRTLDILALIAPLRYDVLVRADYFAWLRENGSGLSDAEVVEAARALPYRVWFTAVAMTRFRPWVLKEPAVLEEQFAERVVSARRLAESVAQHGFDPAHPVTLRATSGVVETDTGARLTKALHVGDGGHRLALLLSMGSALEPHMYRVDPRKMPVLDNTGVLARELRLDESAYSQFVGREFVASPPSTIAELHRSVLTQAPVRIGELDTLLRAHGRGRSSEAWTGPGHRGTAP